MRLGPELVTATQAWAGDPAVDPAEQDEEQSRSEGQGAQPWVQEGCRGDREREPGQLEQGLHRWPAQGAAHALELAQCRTRRRSGRARGDQYPARDLVAEPSAHPLQQRRPEPVERAHDDQGAGDR